MTTPDMHHTRMYWSPQRDPTPGKNVLLVRCWLRLGCTLLEVNTLATCAPPCPEQPLRASRMPRGCASSEACRCGWRGGGSEIEKPQVANSQKAGKRQLAQPTSATNPPVRAKLECRAIHRFPYKNSHIYSHFRTTNHQFGDNSHKPDA